MHKININLSTAHSYLTSEINLWSGLPLSVVSLLGSDLTQNNRLRNSKCSLAVVGLCLLIEGFITDLIINEIKIDNSELTPDEIATLTACATWNDKMNYFYKVFKKKIDEFKCYESVKSVFILRNNIAHGRTYGEKIKFIDVDNSEKAIMNSNYELVLDYLISKKIKRRSKENEASPYIFWQPDVIAFYLVEIKIFLFDLLETSYITNKVQFKSDLEVAFQLS